MPPEYPPQEFHSFKTRQGTGGILAYHALLRLACRRALENTEENTVKKLTPMLFVESIEPSLPFWIDRLGFTKTMEVPREGGEGLVFALLTHGPAAVMLQTYASVVDAAPHLLEEVQKGPSFLFVEVADLAALEPKLAGVEVVVPKHETFYGATEIGVREPGGHLITLAQMPER